MMKCPRCGEPCLLCTRKDEVYVYCDSCDTTVDIPIDQAMINKLWVKKDMGVLHDDALVGL